MNVELGVAESLDLARELSWLDGYVEGVRAAVETVKRQKVSTAIRLKSLQEPKNVATTQSTAGSKPEISPISGDESSNAGSDGRSAADGRDAGRGTGGSADASAELPGDGSAAESSTRASTGTDAGSNAGTRTNARAVDATAKRQSATHSSWCDCDLCRFATI